MEQMNTIGQQTNDSTKTKTHGNVNKITIMWHKCGTRGARNRVVHCAKELATY